MSLARPPSGRPLRRRLVRAGALVLLGPGRAHRADLWPGLAIRRQPGGESGEVLWQGREFLRLTPVRALVPPGRDLLAVVGTGPSLRLQDPARLPAGSALLVNGALSLAERITPLAGLVEDERFVHRHAEMIGSLRRKVPLLLSAAALRATMERAPGALDGRPVALIDDLRKPVDGPRRDLSDPTLDQILERGEGGAALSRDPGRGVVIVGTVAFTALQVALAARPRAILVAGVDLANAESLPRFYETAGAAAPTGLVRGLGRILAGFALARQVAGREGVGLACASPVSALLALGYPRDARLDRVKEG